MRIICCNECGKNKYFFFVEYQAEFYGRQDVAGGAAEILVNSTDGSLERNPFLQWIQGIFGVTTTEAPVLLSPPDDCESCCEFLL